MKPLRGEKRDEAGSLVPSETTLPPLQLRIANDNIFWGVDPPAKERTLRKKITGEPGGGGGRDTQSKGRTEMVLSVERMSEN